MIYQQIERGAVRRKRKYAVEIISMKSGKSTLILIQNQNQNQSQSQTVNLMKKEIRNKMNTRDNSKKLMNKVPVMNPLKVS